MINQEELFQAIQKEDWEYLMEILHGNKETIHSDSLLTLAASTFISEFFKKVDNYPDNHLGTISNLENLFVLDAGNFYKLDETDRKKLICQIVKRKKDKLDEAYSYAKQYPNEKICKTVITEYEKSKPKTIEHSQADCISVTEKKEVSNVDYTIKLFKSLQEIQFFTALKNTYPAFHIYPNVSISCLLNWQLLENELTIDSVGRVYVKFSS